MEQTTFKKGKKLITEGQSVDRMYVVLAGTIDQYWKGQHLTLGPGTVAGLADALNTHYDSDYTALEEIKVIPCFYQSFGDLDRVFDQMPVYIFGFSKGAFRQCRDVFRIYEKRLQKVEDFYDFCTNLYGEYSKLCQESGCDAYSLPLMSELEPIILENRLKSWEIDYINSLNTVDNKDIEAIYGKRVDIVKGVIGISCSYMQRAMDCVEIMGYYLEEFAPILLSLDGMDMFRHLYELRKYQAQRRINPDQVTSLIEILYNFVSESGLYDAALIKSRYGAYKNHNFHEDTQAYEQAIEEQEACFQDAFGHICQFAGFTAPETDKMRSSLTAYLNLADREGREDKDRRIRKKAVEMFYKVYEAAFFRSLKIRKLDPTVEMFLHFGFMDVDAVGPKIAEQLMELTKLLFLCQGDHVFTIYTWLRAIYFGQREPSKNELDLDYRAWVLEERKSGNITEDQVPQWMTDQTKKVQFEINNFFKSANRSTSGKMSSFCPILTDEGFANEPDRMMVTEQKLKDSMKRIEDVDFSIFLREAYFTDMEAGVKNEPYPYRVEPDIILLPNCGLRAMMWQECGGIKADTPGRFVFPLFTLDDIDKLMTYCCGAFRWDICRKEQGARWNDIASQCLTSDFYDYFTFYRKNKDLSADQKDKVKNLLKSSRNNMREAFAKQYATWINFEAQGSVRLNKVERGIFAIYCPFAKAYRDAVASHPMYEHAITRYETKTGQILHHLKMICDKYEKNGGKIPEDVIQGLKYLQM